ncbi:MAG TPA: acyltransferase [Anaeromyxobacteraceae bacterium]|nr:acyltransferase [Anaeromyxobacteraceae bacterium]
MSVAALRGALWTRRLGAGARATGTPWISNQGRLAVGARFRLSCLPVQSHLVVARGAALEIGDDVVVGHGAAIAAHRSIRIGSGCRIGPFANIADTDFHVAGQRDAEPETTPIAIGRGVRIGARVTILRGAAIGDGATVEAGSVVSGIVAAGARVGGVPARPRGERAVGADGEDLPTRVSAAVARALGLAVAPGLDAGREAVPGWDSLGALLVLLALEEEFGVTLDEGKAPQANGVGDLLALVDAALRNE